MPVPVGMMTRASLVIAAAVAVSACDRQTVVVPGGGVSFQPSAAVVTLIQPQTLVRQPIVTFGCPLLPPLTTSFQVVVQQPPVDVFLTEVRLEFFDGFSSHGEPIPFLREVGKRLREIHVRSARNKLWLEDLEDSDIDYRKVAEYLKEEGLAPLIVVELAYRPNTIVTRSLEEDLRLSRIYAERIFGVKANA